MKVNVNGLVNVKVKVNVNGLVNVKVKVNGSIKISAFIHVHVHVHEKPGLQGF